MRLWNLKLSWVDCRDDDDDDDGGINLIPSRLLSAEINSGMEIVLIVAKEKLC